MAKRGKLKAIAGVGDLVQDPGNMNLGTVRGRELLSASLKAHGAGRAVLVDRKNLVMAGNKTVAEAVAQGLTKVRVVDVSGDELVVVRRTDLDLSKGGKARALAVADNRVSEVNFDLDVELLLAEVGGGLELGEMYLEAELEELQNPPDKKTRNVNFNARDKGATTTCPKCGHHFEA